MMQAPHEESDHPPVCAADLMPSGMTLPLPAVNDEEGERVAAGLPFVVDAHVHIFSDRLLDAIWRWFDQFGWPIRYRLSATEVVRFLRTRGVGHVVALHYAHKPGIARAMNAFVAEVAWQDSAVTGMATVFPGEPGAVAILEEAFALGLKGVKLHCHVQCMGPDAPALDEIYATCARHHLPLVMHAGKEPHSPAYKCNPREICSAGRVERVLQDHPALKLCVPHLGADEFDAYEDLLERYDNLWLDTTMVLADYFAIRSPRRLVEARPDRIMYGTDFPNLPYAWDRELRRIGTYAWNDALVEQVLHRTACGLFGIEVPQ